MLSRIIPRKNVTLKKVNAIRSHRNLTGVGLKESKHAFDMAGLHGSFTADLGKVSRNELMNFVTDCFDAGYEIELMGSNPVYAEYCQELRQIISQQILCGHDDIAQDLMAIVQAYMPMEVLPVNDSQLVVDNIE